MKIAYIGWGSLLWNNEVLQLKNNFKHTQIKLPINYSRISFIDENNNGKLTLIIDEKYGEKCNIWYGETKIKNLDKAINTLKKREYTIKDNIGYYNFVKGTFRSKNLSKKNLNKLKSSFKNKGFDAIIWTDLSSNWDKVEKNSFSNLKAEKYIQSRKYIKELYEKQIEYIKLCYKFAKINLPITKKIIKDL